jgi:hypothetical protein
MTSSSSAQTPDPSLTMHIELRERLVAIETKLDHFNETRNTAYKALAIAERTADDIKDLKVYANENRITSATAKNMAEGSSKDITELKDSLRWSHRTTIVLVGAAALNFIINYLQGL